MTADNKKPALTWSAKPDVVCCRVERKAFRGKWSVVAESAPHGWTEVYYNGKWRICDPDCQIPGWKQPAFRAYMMDKHDWDVRAYRKSELIIKNGKAVRQ